jgi:SPP1 family predicted phage head-tail adaptor
MNRKMTLQSKANTTDSQGGFTQVWSDVVVLWCNLKPVKAYEKFQAGQLQTPVTHKISTRYNSAVTNAHRLVHEGRIFDIKEVINVGEESAFLDITAIEKVV